MKRSFQDQEGGRRAELLDLILDYAQTHGLSGISLRPLAAAVGSSPRVLLYFFGSKEAIIQEVLALNRDRQRILVQEVLTVSGRDPAAVISGLWRWLTDPQQQRVIRLFFEGYARSLQPDPGPWQGFGQASVREWLDLLSGVLDVPGVPEGSVDRQATLLLAALRGLLLDLLATGETERITAALDDLLYAMADRGHPIR
ncbi:MAG: TetR family transcriptional regulator [Streptosporangiales bacterium]|nr:TetR family transcriptional regulator [Streptosporangiales bacterium]